MDGLLTTSPSPECAGLPDGTRAAAIAGQAYRRALSEGAAALLDALDRHPADERLDRLAQALHGLIRPDR